MCMPSRESELFSPPNTRGPSTPPTKVSSPPATDPSSSPTTTNPIIVSSVSPTKAPNTSPTTKEELTGDGCCSLDFKTCINWCGPTKDSCLNCNHHDGVFWLPNGKPKEKCRKRWKGCKYDMNGCCDGLTCQENENNFLMCLPFLESEDSSPPVENPTNSPMVPTMTPTFTPTVNPTKTPTKSPTESPTTENPTSKPTVIPSEYPTFTPTTFTPTVSE